MTRRRWILLVVLVVLLAPVLFLCVEHVRGKWSLARTRKAIEARGAKLSIQANIPPFQDGNNRYRDALWALQRLPADAQNEPMPPAMRIVAPGKAIVASREPFWIGIGPENRRVTNAWEDLHARVEPDAKSWSILSSELQAPVLEGRPDYQMAFAMMLPNLAPIKRGAQRLGPKTVWELQAGRREEALQSAVDSVRVGRLLEREPLLISQLVRLAACALALPTAWECLQVEGWSDGQLSRLQQAWEAPVWLPVINSALEMERAMFLDQVLRLHQDPVLANQMIGMPGSAGSWMDQDTMMGQLLDNFSPELAASIGAIPSRIRHFAWLDQDTACYASTLQQFLDASHHAAHAYSYLELSGVLEEIDAHLEGMGLYNRARHLMTLETVPSLLARYPLRVYSAEAHRQLVVAAIALHRHKLRHGSFPGQLADLVPALLSAPPRDPMDGRPLRYRLFENGTFLLYSIGANLQDDGGDASDETRARLTFQNGMDWVWPRAASRAEIDDYYKRERYP